MTKPTIVIDARMVGPTLDGHGRYVTLLARGLASRREAGNLPYDPVFLTRRKPRSEPPVVLAGFESRELASPFLGLRELAEIPAAIRSIRAARPGASIAYHSPTFSSLLHCPVPWLATVHDLNHLQFGTLAKRTYYRTLVKSFYRGARVRLTVSEFTRKELARWAQVPLDSISIAYNAIDPDLTSVPRDPILDRALGQHGLERDRYFFCLSNPKPHKNVSLLVEAYSRYHEQTSESGGTPLPLVLNVDGYRHRRGVLRVGPFSGPELPALLASAAACLAPSRYEGFGLPPLEAAVLGAPVAVSKIPPHEEALSPFRPEEVLWVAPLDAEGWTAAFHRAAEGTLTRPGPESRTRARERFSVANLGATMDAIYRRILGCSPY